jgi:hypothetical protein
MRDHDRPTADQLRDAIDRGRAGDKVGASDPSAAPLGTDAEAGGAPPRKEELRGAWRAEIASDARADRADTDARKPRPADIQQGAGRGRAVILFVAVAIVATILLAFVL